MTFKRLWNGQPLNKYDYIFPVKKEPEGDECIDLEETNALGNQYIAIRAFQWVFHQILKHFLQVFYQYAENNVLRFMYRVLFS